jgi:hypothetical protein
MNADKIREAFRAILQEVGIDGVREIDVVADIDSTTVLSTTASDGVVTLRMNPDAFNKVVTDAGLLKEALKHEACHLLTTPDFDVPVRDGPPELIQANLEYVDLLREYIAHQEYINRFGREYGALASRIFDPGNTWDATIQVARPGRGRGSIFALYVGVFRMFYDAIYFDLVGDQRFDAWCEQAGLPGLGRLFAIVMDDMKAIWESGLSYSQQLEAMNDSFRMVLLVDLDSLLDEGKLRLLRSPSEIAGAAETVARRWQRRGLVVADRR